ncbi:MAG: hypothetical protein P1V81_13720 [Planctomycetota bacterium]|nr:hypothetical protein [Planctomycetota bacterium]
MAIETSQPQTACTSLTNMVLVHASVIYNTVNAAYDLNLETQGEPGSGEDPGDLVVYPGSWNVTFKLVNSPDCRFALGPVLTGPSAPTESGENEVEFRITQIRTDEVNMTFTLDAQSRNCEYAIRVLAPDGTTIVKDPKVINRGYPPLPQTPPLVP